MSHSARHRMFMNRSLLHRDHPENYDRKTTPQVRVIKGCAHLHPKQYINMNTSSVVFVIFHNYYKIKTFYYFCMIKC